jgi:predicted SAM-dependent methyltransferase
MIKLNLGSGQRPFSKDWTNVDVRDQGYKVDVLTDIRDLSMFEDNSVDIICLHHVVEHIDIGELESYISEWYRVLKVGGRLDIFVPNIPKLFEAWYRKEISTYILNVNIYGAYQGFPGDLHRWGYNEEELLERVSCINPETLEPKFKWSKAYYWNGKPEEDYLGADIAQDWWILGVTFLK